MTPTPAETALWRALNVEPKRKSPKWEAWSDDECSFHVAHPADRLAYFEGKVREKGWVIYVREIVDAYTVEWYSDENHSSHFTAPTEHLARFHAAARAIHALGMITEQQLKEIDL